MSGAGTTTAVIQIGNTDDKLSQGEWSRFCDSMGDLVNALCSEIHYMGGSPANAPWQNACWVIAVPSDALDDLRRNLASIARRYQQDSIALTVGDTEFVRQIGGDA